MRSTFLYADVISLIRTCYGKYNSFRVQRIGMQRIDELTQYVSHVRNPLSIILREEFIQNFGRNQLCKQKYHTLLCTQWI